VDIKIKNEYHAPTPTKRLAPIFVFVYAYIGGFAGAAVLIVAGFAFYKWNNGRGSDGRGGGRGSGRGSFNNSRRGSFNNSRRGGDFY